jgi:hypothetical protein
MITLFNIVASLSWNIEYDNELNVFKSNVNSLFSCVPLPSGIATLHSSIVWFIILIQPHGFCRLFLRISFALSPFAHKNKCTTELCTSVVPAQSSF